MNICENEILLEIGFGNGKFISEIVERQNNIKYLGIDISDVMVADAKKINHELINQGKVQLVEANSVNIPFENESIDKVCLINTFYFLEDPLTDLKEIYRVLKPTGKIFISIRSKDKLQQDSFSKYYFKLYENSEIEELIEKGGFKNIDTQAKLEPGKEKFLDMVCIIAEK